MSMKKLLVLVALGTVIAAPAFAQHDPNVRGRASQQQRSTVPPGGIYYYERNNNTNPDFQLGGERWKTNHRHHRAHPASPSHHRVTLQ
jgi:hypothetical protein